MSVYLERPDPDATDVGLRDLLDIELIPLDADRSRRIGKSLKCLQSQPAEGFWAISREIPFPLPI